MTIVTNDGIEKFGTAAKITAATPGAVASTVLSLAADIDAWTNTDDLSSAMATLVCTFGTAPAAGTTVDLYAQFTAVNTEGDDDEVPTTTFKETYLGSFPLKATTSEQVKTIEIPLSNWKSSSIYQFYVLNGSAVSMSASVWELWIAPKTVGPKV